MAGMSEERKQALGEAVSAFTSAMLQATNLVLVQAMDDGLVYPIHGEQVATPPGAVRDVWKVRVECLDGYARTFDEQRQTLNEISSMLAKEEMERAEIERFNQEEGGN